MGAEGGSLGEPGDIPALHLSVRIHLQWRADRSVAGTWRLPHDLCGACYVEIRAGRVEDSEGVG